MRRYVGIVDENVGARDWESVAVKGRTAVGVSGLRNELSDFVEDFLFLRLKLGIVRASTTTRGLCGRGVGGRAGKTGAWDLRA